MTTVVSRLVVLVPPELESGFRLAGADTRPVEDVDDVARTLDELAHDPETAVIAVHRPLFDRLAPERRRRIARSLRPIVVSLPDGREREPAAIRHARLMGTLQRAVGYHITFGGEQR